MPEHIAAAGRYAVIEVSSLRRHNSREYYDNIRHADYCWPLAAILLTHCWGFAAQPHICQRVIRRYRHEYQIAFIVSHIYAL